MPGLREHARSSGWPHALTRAFFAAHHRLRDRSLARALHSAGFRCGRAPRLLGLNHMRLGINFHAGDNLWLEAVTRFAGQDFTPELLIGDNISVSDRVHIGCLASITIGAGTLIGSSVLINDHTHGRYTGSAQTGPALSPTQRPLHSPAPIRIGANVWIGDSVSILPGADIGDGAIIGTGSIVTGIIPPATIAFGAPARPRRWWSEIEQQWLEIQP
jgi:lipopolysaccharide O-acetyltransferase